MRLNEKYRIIYDSENVILQFHEPREMKKFNEVSRQYEGTGEFKEFVDSFFYPSLETALNGFLNKSLWEIGTAKEILEKIEEVKQTIKTLKIKN